MSAAASSASSLLYYWVQNDAGESAAAPNCARLPAGCGGASGRAVTLADVLAVFPLAGSGAFHFRFQVAQEGATRYLDVLGAADAVPTVAGGHVVAKVLRLDTLSSQARPGAAGAALPALRAYASRASALGTQAQPVSASASASASAATATAPLRRPVAAPTAPPAALAASSLAPAAAAAAATPAQGPSRVGSGGGGGGGGGGSGGGGGGVAFVMPVMRAGQAHHVVPKEEDGDPHIRDTGEAVDIYAGLKREDAQGMRAVRVLSHDEAPAVVPDEVDGDLDGKSDEVKAKVMARRAELRRVQAERQSEMDAAAAAELREADEKDAARQLHEKRINAWALEPLGGKPREVRTLLVTLHTVLWEGSGWEPLGLDKVVIASRVRVHFMRACTKVHPDKQSAMSAAQRYIATQVFSYLTTAFRDFEEKELN